MDPPANRALTRNGLPLLKAPPGDQVDGEGEGESDRGVEETYKEEGAAGDLKAGGIHQLEMDGVGR